MVVQLGKGTQIYNLLFPPHLYWDHVSPGMTLHWLKVSFKLYISSSVSSKFRLSCNEKHTNYFIQIHENNVSSFIFIFGILSQFVPLLSRFTKSNLCYR